MVRMDLCGHGGDSGEQAGVIGRLGLSLFFLFFFGMGSLFVVLMLREIGRAAGQRFWKAVPCTITSSEVQERGSGESPFEFAVSYEYTYDGRQYGGTAYKRRPAKFGRYSDVQELVQKYRTGGTATCYVNPANPNDAVLTRDSLLIGLAIPIPLIFVVIGAGGIYFIWRKARPEKVKPVVAIAVSATGKKGWGRLGLTGFFGIFAVAGGAMLYPLGIEPIAKTIDARSWVETPCRVIRAEVRSHSSDDGTTYSVYVLYQYEFGRQTHKADRYEFIGGSSSGYKSKARVVAQYKSDPSPVCYVNPRDPTEAVLKRGFHTKLLLVLFPLVFLAVGVGGIVGSFRHRSRIDPVTGLPRVSVMRAPSDSTTSLLRVPGAGPVTLKSKHSPSVRLLGAVMIAVFWNGIISIFLFQVVQGFRQGHPQWFLTFFMVPFVSVGVGLVAMVAHQFLAMFNPRPTLALSADSVPLGGAAELSWRLSGRTSRIREFTVTLRGIEEARYRRGTKTHTDRNTFYELELYRTSDGAEIASGQVGFIVPSDTMHSLEAENNKIRWSLDVCGDIKRWPDVKESFPLQVLPG